MGSKIFISYRRVDTAATCGRIYDRLAATFGKEAVFKDVDAIPFGVDFRTAIRGALDQCAVQLVVIGPQWLDVKDSHGRRRLDDVGDAVRFEVETALQRGLVTIPVLVQGASVPSVQQLPPGLQPLAYINASQLRFDPDFDNDMHRLLNAIERIVPPLPSATPPSGASAKPQVARIARQPASLGTLTRWGLAFGVPLAFVEVLLVMTATYDANFNANKLGIWLISGMLALALAVFFVIGLFVARRTGEIGPGFFAMTVTTILASVVVVPTVAWSDGVERAAQAAAQGSASTTGLTGGVTIDPELLISTLILVVVCVAFGIAASAVGGAIGKRVKPPAVDRLARSRIVVRVSVVAGLLLALIDGILAIVVEASQHDNTNTGLVATWTTVIVLMVGLFVAAIVAGRNNHLLGSGLLASLLAGVIAGAGTGFLGAWAAGLFTVTTTEGGNPFIGSAGFASLGFAVLGLVSGLLPGVIGGAIGQSLGRKAAGGPRSTGGRRPNGGVVVSEPVRAGTRRASAPR